MDRNLLFISSKVKELKTALFYNFGESLFKFPPTVIEIRDVDEEGNAWFAVSKLYDNVNWFDKEFPAELQLYNKNYPYYMKVQGKAFLMVDPAPMPHEVGLTRCDGLVKLKIMSAECIDLSQHKPARRNLRGLVENLFAWLFHTNEGYYYDWN